MTDRATSATPMQETFTASVDPVTFEVVRHALWQINDEQGRTIINVSGSPVASEVNDFNVALTTADGQLVMLGPYNLHQMGAISVVIKKAIETLGDEVHPGDLYLTNDPWMGALHHNDVCCVAPIHRDGELVGWSACTVHQVDVGGTSPGSWNLKARDTFDEAPRYRFLRVLAGGTVQPEVVSTYLANSRTPDVLELDLRAMIASANVVKDRLETLFDKYGTETVLNVMQDCIEYSRILLVRRLREIPDGEWKSEDYLDHDGHGETIHTIRLRLEKKADRLIFDYRDTDDQAPGFINCTYAGCLAGSLASIMTQLCSGIPWNGGVIECLDVRTREGSLNDARFPAPTGMGTISGCLHTSNAAQAAIAQMMSDSHDRIRQDLMANWCGSAYVYNVFGKNQYGEAFGTMMVDSHLGGGGARFIGDGYDTSGTLSVPRPSVANIESLESLYPLLYLHRRLNTDSGGPGRHRGGVSAQTASTVYGVDKLSVTVSTLGSDHSNAVGARGGYPGGSASAILIEGCDPITQLKGRHLEDDPAEWGGDRHMLPPKHPFELRTGDVFISIPHGGGGYEDPLLRQPERVARDVLEAHVSPAEAERVYGTRLEPDSLAVLEEETKALRTDIRRRRLEAAEVDLIDPASVETLDRDDPFERIEGGVLAQGTEAFCPHCEQWISSLQDYIRTGLPTFTTDLGEAGPWVSKRHGGVSPNFVLEHAVCPRCGALLDVRERRRVDHRRAEEGENT